MKIYAEFPNGSQEPGSIVWPDSCWLLSNRPLYIPDFAPAFVAIPMLAVKIGRLGKNVAPRFASRYVSERTAALVILPADTVADVFAGIPSPPAAYCFDNAVVLGDWADADAGLAADASLTLDVEQADRSERSVTHAEAGCQAADEAIMHALVRLSRHNTLKMGDVVMAPLGVPPIPLEENATVTVTAATADAGQTRKLLFTRFK